MAKYEGDIQAIGQEVANYYQRTGDNTIKEDWEKYKEEYQQKKIMNVAYTIALKLLCEKNHDTFIDANPYIENVLNLRKDLLW